MKLQKYENKTNFLFDLSDNYLKTILDQNL